MKIAYLTSVYARASDTFIRNEVLDLRRRGHDVHTFSIRRAAGDVDVSEEVRAEQARTDYILERGAARLAWSLLKTAAGRPGRLAQVLRLVARTRPRAGAQQRFTGCMSPRRPISPGACAHSASTYCTTTSQRIRRRSRCMHRSFRACRTA